jgi:trigger factor
LESKITKQGNSQRIVEVDLSDAELQPHFEAVFEKYKKNLKIQGFRKGKVPVNLIKKLFGEEIKNEAIEEVVERVFREVRAKENLRPVAPAKLEDIKYEPEQGLHFKATVEVVPEIELKNYKDLAVEREIYEVSEDDVADALENVRERLAVMQPVEEAAREDHYLLADFQEVDVSGVPVIGKKFEDRFFRLNGEGLNKDITQQLIGVKAGEMRRIELSSQDGTNHQKKEYFNVNVKEIKSKQLPELDDELAKDTGKFQTLDELKSDILEKLIKQAQAESQHQLRHNLIDEVLKRNSFDLPEVMIQNYLDALAEGAKRDKNSKFDEEAFRNEYRTIAIWNIKWELAKDKIIELENLQVSDPDKEAFIARVAAERGIDAAKLRKSFENKNAQKQLLEDVLETKVIDFLQQHAKIKERKVTRKDRQRSSQLAVTT